MREFTSQFEEFARPDLLCDTRWTGHQGIAKFSNNVLARLPGMTALPAGLPLFHPFDSFWLSQVISRARPRVYFSPGFNPPLRSVRPFVFVVHDLNYVHCRENSDALRRAFFQLIVRPACRRAARVLTVSEFSRSQIIEWSNVRPEQVVNVGAGVDASFTPNGERYEPGFPYVLYVGNRSRHKNLDRLFQAFALVQLDCKLLLSGSADEATLAIARRRGIEESLRFAGPIEDGSMPALYRGARAVVLPSLFEGFGLPIVEAMACGVPVLTSNVTSMPEIAGDAAVLVDPRNVEELASGLNRLIADASLRARLSARGLQRAAEFSWDRTATAVRAVLDDVR